MSQESRSDPRVFTEQPRPPRAEEVLDTARLDGYLKDHLPGYVGPPEILQFPSGHSNLTYLVRAGNREWVLRRPPFGSKVKTAHDMGREHRILSRLSRVFPPAPAPVLLCEDSTVLGAPFYMMERRSGLILRRDLPNGLDLAPDTARKLCENLIDTLADLHLLDYKAVGLEDLGKPQGYIERQVTGWTRRYRDSRTDDVPDILRAAEWLAAHRPPEKAASLIHNDYKFDNVVLDPQDPTRIIGVLDWEMSTLGDPLMDLGTTLGYWVQPDDTEEMQFIRFGPTHRPGFMTRRELAERYGRRTGFDVSDLTFYYCFALFKTAVVLQQIYYRYVQGLTRDERFAPLIHGVRILAGGAVRALERGGI